MVINLEKKQFIYCRDCGGQCPENAVACHSCGVPPKKGNNFCNSCGLATNKNAVICVKCGCALSKENDSTLMFESQKEAKKVEVRHGDVVSSGTAILWWLVCYPVGYSQWGQATKGWVSLLFFLFTGGYGGIVILVDYIKCYNAQKTRELGEWEFFPKS